MSLLSSVRMSLLSSVASFLVVGVAGAAVIQVPSAQAPTITIAINIAANGDEIVVAPGVYFEAISLNGKTITLRSSDGPETTVIDGLGQFKSVVRIISGEGPATVIEGFTIRNGVATAAAPGDRGGGIYCNLTSPTIRDCIFVANQGIAGGAFYANGGAPTLIDCVFLDNDAVTALGDGGAIYANNTTITATGCVFDGNASVRFGGAVRGTGSTSIAFTDCSFTNNAAGANGGAVEIAAGATPYVFRDCRFEGNQTTGNGTGGAVHIASSTAVNHLFINGVFLGNAAGGEGGAIRILGRAELINCTLVQNTAGANGGAAQTSGTALLLARNCIVWANAPLGFSGPLVSAIYTCHQSPIAGAGNFVADPKFLSLATGDLRLAADSPCIDAGNTTLLPSNVATDAEGLARAVNVLAAPTGVAAFGYVIDLGAFEYPTPIAPSTCPGDVNGDGFIDAADLATLLGGWGPCD